MGPFSLEPQMDKIGAETEHTIKHSTKKSLQLNDVSAKFFFLNSLKNYYFY